MPVIVQEPSTIAMSERRKRTCSMTPTSVPAPEKLSEEITHLLSPADKLAVNAYIIGVLIPVLVDGSAVAMI